MYEGDGGVTFRVLGPLDFRIVVAVAQDLLIV